jgi:hypothetical protein
VVFDENHPGIEFSCMLCLVAFDGVNKNPSVLEGYIFKMIMNCMVVLLCGTFFNLIPYKRAGPYLSSGTKKYKAPACSQA